MSVEDKYLIDVKIGCGTFGCVYRGYDISTNEVVAIKKIYYGRLKGEKVINEVNNLRHLKDHCPQVVRYKERFIDRVNNILYLVMEYIEAGPYLETNDHNNLTLFIRLVKAIKCIHDNGVVHGDIKPDNIVITNNDIKLIDFGDSCPIEDIKCPCTIGGSPSYSSPELIADQINNFTMAKASDVWAMGVSFYYLLYGKYPYDEDAFDKFYRVSRQQLGLLFLGEVQEKMKFYLYDIEEKDDGFGGKINRVLKEVLNVVWGERPNIEGILEMLE